MALPQDIRPLNSELAEFDHALVGDSLDRDQARPGLEQGAVGRPRIGPLAVLLKWKKGCRAAGTRYLSAAFAFILSGKLQVRNNVYNAGDFLHETNGMVHGATTALEDTEYLFFCDGPVLFFDKDNFTATAAGKRRCARRRRRRRNRPLSEGPGEARRGRAGPGPASAGRNRTAVDHDPTRRHGDDRRDCRDGYQESWRAGRCRLRAYRQSRTPGRSSARPFRPWVTRASSAWFAWAPADRRRCPGLRTQHAVPRAAPVGPAPGSRCGSRPCVSAPSIEPIVGCHLRLDFNGRLHRIYFEEAGPEAGAAFRSSACTPPARTAGNTARC